MLPANLYALFLVLPFSSAIITCRIACRRCREKLDHPEMLEVYCAMCEECKERRREWLEGAPSLLRVDPNENYLTNYGQQEDDCPTTPADEQCDEPLPLSRKSSTTSTTTTSTTTTTITTRKPCPPRPCVKATRAPCLGVGCALPIAVPICPMCPAHVTGLFHATTPSDQSTSIADATRLKQILSTSSSKSELYFYVGVPKKLLKQFQSAPT